MMTLTREQQKKLFAALLVALGVLIAYRITTNQKPATAALTYAPGSVAPSAVRTSARSQSAGADPLQAFLIKREEKFPGVARDIFRMENPAPPKPKAPPKPVVAPEPIAPPPPPVKTPEEIAAEEAKAAAEAARADLGKFRFLGYLTDQDRSLFLSKDGELFITKNGETVVKSYKVKEAGKDFVILLDTATRVEARVELSGGEQPKK